MPLVLVRIDDRLIHGQVVEGWLRTIHANHIIVANDEVAGDEMQCALLSLATPNNVKLSVLNIEQTAKQILDNTMKDDRVLLLFSNPVDVLRLVEKGVELESINVGGLHFYEGKTQVSKALCVDNKDIQALLSLGKKGIKLEARIVPTDERIDVLEMLVKCGLLE